MKSLRPTTKLAVQIFIALFIITLLGDLCKLPRTYWAALAAVSVLCQTWGESLRKSGQRILATIAGMTLGLLLNIPFEQVVAVELVLILTCVFFMSYFGPVSYVRSIFFLSVMLAMIFGISGDLTQHVYWTRITETMVGAGVAILTAILVFPTQTGTDFYLAITDYLKKVQCANTQMLQVLLTGKPVEACERIHLDREYQELARLADIYLYERSLRRATAVKVKAWMLSLQSMSFYHTNLTHAVMGNIKNPTSALLHKEIEILSDLLSSNTEQAVLYIQEQPYTNARSLVSFQEKLRERFEDVLIEPGKERTKILDFLPIFYFSYKINDRIIALMKG